MSFLYVPGWTVPIATNTFRWATSLIFPTHQQNRRTTGLTLIKKKPHYWIQDYPDTTEFYQFPSGYVVRNTPRPPPPPSWNCSSKSHFRGHFFRELHHTLEVRFSEFMTSYVIRTTDSRWTNQTVYRQLNQVAAPKGFLLVQGVTIDAHHHPSASCDVPWCLMKLLP